MHPYAPSYRVIWSPRMTHCRIARLAAVLGLAAVTLGLTACEPEAPAPPGPSHFQRVAATTPIEQQFPLVEVSGPQALKHCSVLSTRVGATKVFRLDGPSGSRTFVLTRWTADGSLRAVSASWGDRTGAVHYEYRASEGVFTRVIMSSGEPSTQSLEATAAVSQHLLRFARLLGAADCPTLRGDES